MSRFVLCSDPGWGKGVQLPPSTAQATLYRWWCIWVRALAICSGSQVDGTFVSEEDLEIHLKPAQVWHRVAVIGGGVSGGSHLLYLKRGCVVTAPPLVRIKLEPG